METYFVVRDTNHPAEDLKRNWSAVLGGHDSEAFYGKCFATLDEAKAAYKKAFGDDCRIPDLRWHPAHDSFVPVHFEGLGAWQLQAETLAAALEEAAQFDDYLACTSESGDGHFFAYQCVGFHKVREGKYVFELKDRFA
jgi:hypothetical protein